MADDYVKAPSDVKELVNKIRSKYYSKYKKAKIITLMKLGKWSKYGTIARVSTKQRQAGIDADYILTLQADAWRHFDKRQKKALVDHELAHMRIVKTKKGKQFRLRHHEVEEFIDIVKRHGKWQESLERMHEAMEKSK